LATKALEVSGGSGRLPPVLRRAAAVFSGIKIRRRTRQRSV